MSEESTLERLEKLEERLVEAEVKLDTLATGQSLICSALEQAGLMKNGEPVQPATWDPSKIKWVQAEGSKGPYERYPEKGQKAEATEDYKAMLAHLKAHNGKMMHGDYFFWLFSDATTVGRKLRKGKKPKPQAATKADVETIKANFPSDLAQLLSFQVEGQFVVLKPTKFLGSENFGKIASVVRDSGGEYVSAGRESHFRVPIRG